MYSTPKDHRPSKPFITSQRHAGEEFSLWLKENDLHCLEDRDGLVWDLNVQSKELPRRNDLHGGEWHLTFLVTCAASAEDFVRTGTLDEAADKRLLEILAEQRVQLGMRPRKIKAATLESARSAIMDQVEALRKDMKSADLGPVKRSLIGRHVDRMMAFGGMR